MTATVPITTLFLVPALGPVWSAADGLPRVPLVPSGPTTLNGEGLQHQDGPLCSSPCPTRRSCLRPGLRLRWRPSSSGHGRDDGKTDVIYYITDNENFVMPAKGGATGHPPGLTASRAESSRSACRLWGPFCPPRRCGPPRNSGGAGGGLVGPSYPGISPGAMEAKGGTPHPTRARPVGARTPTGRAGDRGGQRQRAGFPDFFRLGRRFSLSP
ncbi:MAG: hypothetical protein CM15mP18_3290 [Methanobacteriota archaeon]|nr:MAG: hypothetical protein CM15mP18_3290 [Euryarchaeota archaeon]